MRCAGRRRPCGAREMPGRPRACGRSPRASSRRPAGSSSASPGSIPPACPPAARRTCRRRAGRRTNGENSRGANRAVAGRKTPRTGPGGGPALVLDQRSRLAEGQIEAPEPRPGRPQKRRVLIEAAERPDRLQPVCRIAAAYHAAHGDGDRFAWPGSRREIDAEDGPAGGHRSAHDDGRPEGGIGNRLVEQVDHAVRHVALAEQHVVERELQVPPLLQPKMMSSGAPPSSSPSPSGRSCATRRPRRGRRSRTGCPPAAPR